MRNTTKGMLAATAITAAMTGAVMASAGSAHADNGQDIYFLQRLNAHGINAGTVGIQWAHGVCSDLAYGDTLTTEARRVYYNTDQSMDWDKSGWFVAVSVATYCPWEVPATSPPPAPYSPPGQYT